MIEDVINLNKRQLECLEEGCVLLLSSKKKKIRFSIEQIIIPHINEVRSCEE